VDDRVGTLPAITFWEVMEAFGAANRRSRKSPAIVELVHGYSDTPWLAWLVAVEMD
jgi:hypothetical protein